VDLKCENCNQPILPTDTVCWHCGKELKPRQVVADDVPEPSDSLPEHNTPISITAVSIFALITLITILLFIITTTLLASYTPG
jgi:hypothetical protein